jgi:S-adenosylmethionine:tRNA ribosyltransferase-isomerase
VGAGTFKPVSAERMEAHDMHRECITVRRQLLEHLLQQLNGCLVAVGTTSLRTLESLYWMGVQLLTDEKTAAGPLPPVIGQWDAYDLPGGINTRQALEALLHWMERHDLETFSTYTQMLIVPGYRLRIATALVTNFHQPQSTLLLLVAAVAGPQWRELYNHALNNDFRFLSYGDGCLLFAAATPTTR